MHPCGKVSDCEKIMEKGWSNRSTGATLMNADSSRSHSIFSIHLERSDTNDNGEQHIRAAKLNLVDLAGSERQGKTGNCTFTPNSNFLKHVACSLVYMPAAPSLTLSQVCH